MTDDENTWSEKGRGKRGSQRPPRESNDAVTTSTSSGSTEAKSTVPSRPSTRREATDTRADTGTVVRTPATEGSRKVARAAATAGQRDTSFMERMGFPALVALICLLGIAAVFYAWWNRAPIEKPREGGVDHWHAVYGVYDCTLPTDEKYLAPFLSSVDASGIHSHGDGIIHIHPFGEASSGTNAKIKHFFNEMGVVVDSDKIGLPNGSELVAGTECADGSGPAEISLQYWQFDFEVPGYADNPSDPEIIRDDIGEHRFQNDREVYILAFAAAGTELPAPPADRFETLNNVTPDLEYNPQVLVPEESGITVQGETEDGTVVEGSVTDESDN